MKYISEMENNYGITVTNRYRLFLDDDEDPLEVLKVQEQAKEAKKKTKVCEKEKENKSKPESKTKQPPQVRKNVREPVQSVKSVDSGKIKEDQKSKPTTQRASQDRDQRNVKFSDSRDREERNNWKNQERGGQNNDFNREPRDRDTARPEGTEGRFRGRGGRGVFRGGRGGPPMRGMRGGLGYDTRGKREYDRQSGSDKTGVKPVDKREGGGAHNWGNHRDEIQEQLNTQVQDDPEWQAEEFVPENPTKDVQASDSEGDTPQPVEEEGPRVLTLDEYYALRRHRQKPTYNIRKAGEGEDPSQWKKMYALTKKKEGEEEEEEEEEYDASEYPQRVGRQKHILDIDIHFADSRRGSRARGRGGMRGGRGMRGTGPVGPARNGGVGRAGPLGDRNQMRDRFDRQENFQNRSPRQQSAPKFDDDHDFPSLA
ncbi:plasminogen activator inhibitor 1 RNA-binding protein-like [Schistocerca gregaria]|uniref:plasminogen activator inhibitor 1 RNA-binding protein-like n=1 Tax=Schistocerca gregaria TaxID=7010 RepID=UPI00211DB6A1|nr:plasminogen activator inhibitor 1 RNA-binding protein-like [Schistocerca gregaria]